jgi:outer membrane murein-binding lipoprotein Lpp
MSTRQPVVVVFACGFVCVACVAVGGYWSNKQMETLVGRLASAQAELAQARNQLAAELKASRQATEQTRPDSEQPRDPALSEIEQIRQQLGTDLFSGTEFEEIDVGADGGFSAALRRVAEEEAATAEPTPEPDAVDSATELTEVSLQRDLIESAKSLRFQSLRLMTADTEATAKRLGEIADELEKLAEGIEP